METTTIASGTQNLVWPHHAKPSCEYTAPVCHHAEMDSEAAEKPQKIAAFREVSRLEWSIFIISASVFIVLFLGILGLTQHHIADEAREHDLNDASEGAALVKILLEETPGTAPTAEVMKKIRDAGMTLEILQGNPPITEANPHC